MKNKDNILLGEAYEAVSDSKLGALKNFTQTATPVYDTKIGDKVNDTWNDITYRIYEIGVFLESQEYQNWYKRLAVDYNDENLPEQSGFYSDWIQFKERLIEDIENIRVDDLKNDRI